MKMTKRIIALVLVLVMVLAMSATAFASAKHTYRYIKSGVHFRTGAGNKCKTIRILPKGAKVELLSGTKKVKTTHAVSTWQKISYGGKTGWVCTKYLTRINPIPEEPKG